MKVRNCETGEVFEAWEARRVGILDLGLVPKFVRDLLGNGELDFKYNGSIILGGDYAIPKGAYVIKESEGDMYWVSKDIFEKTYEVV